MKHKTDAMLGGTFFRLVIYQFYADLIFFIEFSISMRFRKYSDLYTLFEINDYLYGIIPRTLSAIHYYIKIVVYIGYMLFGLNRLLIALNVTSMKRESYAVWSSKIIAYIDGFCSTFTCIFCILCYLFTCGLLRKNLKKTSTVQVFKKSTSQSSAEKGLLISAVLSFFVLMLNTSIQISKVITSWLAVTNIFTIYDLSYPLNDLMYSHFPWVLLITSSVLRKQLIYDIKMFIRSSLKLDEASMSLGRHGTTQMTRGTSRSEP
ncbi:unnamed protein product [Caenorhabditis angaria]|uniref:Serpentine receptor class gamma n=1 Tax=Caenorhabditis angaria TaxID=860376 RepID=A0A9P1IZ48_9PELO|nr:unnamed protein product [Caenorhabditis angaria]